MRQRREELEEQKKQHRAEMDQRREKMRQQRQESSQQESNTRYQAPKPKLHMPVYQEGNDIDDYLAIFDYMCTQLKMTDKERYLRLSTAVPEKVRVAFLALSEGSTYSDLQSTFRRVYHLTPLAYQEKFRGSAKQADESFTTYGRRLKRMLENWKEQAGLDLFDLVLMEQLYNTVTNACRIWLRQSKPKMFQEAVELAETYAEARRGRDVRASRKRRKGTNKDRSADCESRDGSRDRNADPETRDRSRASSPCFEEESLSPADRKGRSRPLNRHEHLTCHYCDQMGHIKRNCPEYRQDQSSNWREKKGRVFVAVGVEPGLIVQVSRHSRVKCVAM